MTGSPGESGRGVLVTGAGRGIGRAVARAFAEAGDRVIVHCSRSYDEAVRVVAKLPGEGHGVLRADLSDPEQVRALARDAIAALGTVDVLVNNAAVMTRHEIATASWEEWLKAWQETTAVTLTAAAHLSFWVARHLIETGKGGRIVNVGSRGAFRGEPDHAAYGASKAGLHSLTQSLAVALAPHDIGVSAVAPGFVQTERVAARLAGPEGDRIRSQSPFGRVGQPHEIAAAVLYLASPHALWSSGTIIDVNGASYLRT